MTFGLFKILLRAYKLFIYKSYIYIYIYMCVCVCVYLCVLCVC